MISWNISQCLIRKSGKVMLVSVHLFVSYLTIFIYVIFNDAVRSSEYLKSNARIILMNNKFKIVHKEVVLA
jgi:hypothetical protein